MANEETARRHNAIIEYLKCFKLSGEPPTCMEDLSDGVALFEALAEIAPSYFDVSGIARNLGENWALKSSNLRKLIRNLETFYHEDLGKTADWNECTSAIPEISRDNNPDAIESLFELVAAAAVTCDGKMDFVQRIMTMSDEGQIGMKSVLERSLKKLEDFDEEGDEVNDDDDDDEEEIDYGNDDDSYDPETAVRNAPSFNDMNDELFSPNELSTIGYEVDGELLSADVAVLTQERDELRKALQDARRELTSLKTKANEGEEETVANEKKLRALVDDLQERLGKRQDELNETERELKKVTRELGDSDVKVKELAEQNAQLADELDVANAKASQLRKAEATVQAYRKKLEGAGVMSLQMADLEDQAADYLRQIMDLENDVKALPGLQKKVVELNEVVSKLQKEKVDLDENLKEKEAEVTRISGDLASAVKDKKMYEEELNSFRESQDVAVDDGGIPNNLSFTSAKSVSQNREKVMRLEIENKRQKDRIAKLEAEQGNTGASTTETKTMKTTINRLKMEKEKLASDKEKLEAYTKKTLAKFQEKYLVALQECKAKLKEKHDKIEALEMRNAAEKNAQKREERLLSSTIYELGLAIMQNRMKDR